MSPALLKEGDEMENVYVTTSPENERELKELLPKDKYNVVPLASPNAEQGRIQVLKITCKLFKSPSLLERNFDFLKKDGIYPIVNRIGNFVEIEGGGYVFLDNVNCKLIN